MSGQHPIIENTLQFLLINVDVMAKTKYNSYNLQNNTVNDHNKLLIFVKKKKYAVKNTNMINYHDKNYIH